MPIGESFHITKDVFEGCFDANIQVLVKLLNRVEGTIDRLCNLNGITLTSKEEDGND